MIHIETEKLTPRIQRYLSYSATNRTTEFTWLGKVRWNAKRLDQAVLDLLGDDVREYNARAIRNLIDRHLLVHSTDIAQCLVSQSKFTLQRGWFWDGVKLLDDIKVEAIDRSRTFLVTVGSDPCLTLESAQGRSWRGSGTGGSSRYEL